jgi:Peptidase A4 family
MKKRLMVSLVPAIACCAFAAPALAATQEAVSENWAGYVATPNQASGFSGVSAQWTQPAVDCSATQQATYSAYWVGIGGGGSNSQALEQIGTQGDCDASGNTSYYAWYELVPSAPVKLNLQINPGDKVYARTVVKGDQITLRIVDQTTGKAWGKTLTMTSATPDTSTAEWVAEAPSECSGGVASGDCQPLPLANFGTATFSDAHATAAGHVGSISDPQFSEQPIALEPSSSSLFGGGDGGYFSQGYGAYSDYSASSSSGAAPTALTDGGTTFSVKYGASTDDASTTGSADPQGQSSGNGYGNSSGYGNSGGYGYSDGYGNGYGDSGGYGYSDGYGDSYGDSGGYGYSDGYGDSYGDSGGYGQSYWGF